MQENITKARQYIGTFRCIDDLLTIDNPHFCSIINTTTNQKNTSIYSPYLELNTASEDINKLDFVGIEINGEIFSFVTNIANSTKKFPYGKINYHALLGNFPQVLGYGVKNIHGRRLLKKMVRSIWHTRTHTHRHLRELSICAYINQ